MKSRSILLMMLMFGMILFMTTVFAQESPEIPPPPSEPPQPDTRSFSAEQHITRIDWFGRANHSVATVYKSGPVIRYEQHHVDPPEISIFDYVQKKEYRVYEGDHIFFELDITDRVRLRAQREGLIPFVEDPNIEVKHLSLGRTVVEGHPSEIILQVRRLKREKRPLAEYTLLWEALDLDRQPIRIAYHQTARTLVVVEYRNLQPGPIDSALLRVPAGYLSFTPF